MCENKDYLKILETRLASSETTASWQPGPQTSGFLVFREGKFYTTHLVYLGDLTSTIRTD